MSSCLRAFVANFFLVGLEEGEHFAVEFVAVVVFVVDVGAVGVEGAEVAAEVPEGVADVVGFEDGEGVAEPGPRVVG